MSETPWWCLTVRVLACRAARDAMSVSPGPALGWAATWLGGLEVGVWGLGFAVWGLGFGVGGWGFGVWGLGPGFWVWFFGLVFRF